MSRDSDEAEFEKTVEAVRRRQRYFRNPPKAANLVAKVLTRYSVAALHQHADWQTAWRNAVEPRFASQTRVRRLRRGKLEVAVANSVVRHQLEFEKHDLIKKLNRSKLFDRNIRDIDFRIGEITTEKQ